MAVASRRRYSPRLPRAERREQVLDASLRLLAQRGFGALSMEGVAREADIAKTVVYDTFGDMDGLLRALFEREQERALADVAAAVPKDPSAGPPLELLVQGLTALLEAVRTHPDHWRLILLQAEGTPPALRTAVERHRKALLAQIAPMVAFGIERLGLGGLDAELAAQLILATSEDAARLTLTSPRRFPPERIAGFAADLVEAFSSAGDAGSRRVNGGQ
jgi:AcrR family transcriptional regulator